MNNRQQDPVRLHQEGIIEVDNFVYMGSVVSKDGGTNEDIKCRMNKARHAFNTLRTISRSTALSLQNKIRIFNINVKTVLLYGAETWWVTKNNTHKLQTFTNRCFRNILGIRWPEVVSNKQLWDRTKQAPVDIQIQKRKWGWIGHTLRKPAANVTRQALDWKPRGKRKVGRPKQTSRRSIADTPGMTWAELKKTSQNRVNWRGLWRRYVPRGMRRHKSSKSEAVTKIAHMVENRTMLHLGAIPCMYYGHYRLYHSISST